MLLYIAVIFWQEWNGDSVTQVQSNLLISTVDNNVCSLSHVKNVGNSRQHHLLAKVT